MKKQLFFLLTAFNVYTFSNSSCPLNDADKQRAQDFLAKHPDARVCLEKGDDKECFSAEILAAMKRTIDVSAEAPAAVAEEVTTPAVETTTPAVETTAPATEAALPTTEQN